MIFNHRDATPPPRAAPTKDPTMDEHQPENWYCPEPDCDYCGGAFTD
ncbi:hypothetical protein PX701_05710 [Agromyces sp. H3Y2-19a]|nr:hypothetical protein [Agromyces chromiiresistens]MDF0513112.1 hypothetical protein [Agromyces chromiiresistens]